MERLTPNRRRYLVGAAAASVAATAATTAAGVGSEAVDMAALESLFAEIETAHADVLAAFAIFNDVERAIINRGEDTEKNREAIKEAEERISEAREIETALVVDLIDYRPRTLVEVRRKCGYLLTCRPWLEGFTFEEENTMVLVESLTASPT